MAQDDLSLLLGNTSTCVEKTPELLFTVRRQEKHLHMRGEDGRPVRRQHAAPGNTSTCVEKTKIGVIFDASFVGNTSTCVEKTGVGGLVGEILGKHLHMRGEDPTIEQPCVQRMETPPHAWRRLRLQAREFSGIRKHLHMRGEDSAARPSS